MQYSNFTPSQHLIMLVEKTLVTMRCDYRCKEYPWYGYFENILAKLFKPHDLVDIANDILDQLEALGGFGQAVLYYDESYFLREETQRLDSLKNELFTLCAAITGRQVTAESELEPANDQAILEINETFAPKLSDKILQTLGLSFYSKRLGRIEFYHAFLSYFILILTSTSVLIAGSFSGPLDILNLVVCFLCFLGLIIISIKRLHDFNRRGWYALVLLVPHVAACLVLWLFFIKGSPSLNAFGRRAYLSKGFYKKVSLLLHALLLAVLSSFIV